MKVSNDALTERVYSNPLYNVYTSKNITRLFRWQISTWQQTRKGKQPTGENGSM